VGIDISSLDKNVTSPINSNTSTPVIPPPIVNHLEGDSFDDDFPHALG
jgi:hypothetical protein